MTEIIKKLYCKRCKKTWWPKTPEKPKTCTYCKSPYWDKGKGWWIDPNKKRDARQDYNHRYYLEVTKKKRAEKSKAKKNAKI